MSSIRPDCYMVLNIIIVLIAYLISIAVFWSWIKRSKLENVSLTSGTMEKIIVRTGLLYVILLVFCLYFDLNAVKVLATIAAVSFILFISGQGFLISPLAGIPIVIYYVLFQWILGFPDKNLWIPPNPTYKQPEPPTHLIGQVGNTQTPLRPVGEVIIEGQLYMASSDCEYIEKDSSVSVVDVRNSNLIVRRQTAAEEERI